MQIINTFYYKNKSLEIKNSKDNIKSHNNMTTFFSGTDLDTLKKEGNDRNHFVSLIVNNEGTYSAAITRKLNITRTTQDCYSYETFDGVSIGDCEETVTEELTEIQYFDLDIEKQGMSSDFTEVDKRLEEIKEAKKSKTAVNTTPYYNSYRTNDNSIKSYYEGTLFDYPKDPVKPKVEATDLVKSIAMQLLTGSIMVTSESSIDIQKYVKGLESVVTRRFGEGPEGLKRYENFIDFFTETVLYDAVDEFKIPKVAEQVYEYITSMPTNEYTEIILDKLTTFMM